MSQIKDIVGKIYNEADLALKQIKSKKENYINSKLEKYKQKFQNEANELFCVDAINAHVVLKKVEHACGDTIENFESLVIPVLKQKTNEDWEILQVDRDYGDKKTRTFYLSNKNDFKELIGYVWADSIEALAGKEKFVNNILGKFVIKEEEKPWAFDLSEELSSFPFLFEPVSNYIYQKIMQNESER